MSRCFSPAELIHVGCDAVSCSAKLDAVTYLDRLGRLQPYKPETNFLQPDLRWIILCIDSCHNFSYVLPLRYLACSLC